MDGFTQALVFIAVLLAVGVLAAAFAPEIKRWLRRDR